MLRSKSLVHSTHKMVFFDPFLNHAVQGTDKPPTMSGLDKLMHVRHC